MLKSFATAILLTAMIFLAACGEREAPKDELNPADNTSTHNTDTDASNENDSEKQRQPKESDFKVELAFDVKSVEDQLTEDERPLLDVLEKNLTGLVKHDQDAFKAGFADEELADTLSFYYGENLLYKFTGIEEVTHHTTQKNQIHIFVTGERLDTTTGNVEDVKLMYAIRKNDQGLWAIYIID